jgi:sulfur carrier protein ThiS adenylyltransferase
MIRVNEKEFPWTEGMTLAALRTAHKPDADITVYNGFPVADDRSVQDGDTVCFIRRGEMPSETEMQQLLVSRHSPKIFDAVKDRTVGIAGVGGLGSALAIALARLSVGKLIIADFDVVEPSNLNRQQYFCDQIGMLKVDAMQANLARINPYLEVETIADRIDADNIARYFGAADVLAECFDNPESKSIFVETVLTTLRKPVVAVSGIAGYHDAEKLVCREPMKNFYLIGDGVSAAQPGAGLMAPKVGIAAHLQASKILDLLLAKRIPDTCR